MDCKEGKWQVNVYFWICSIVVGPIVLLFSFGFLVGFVQWLQGPRYDSNLPTPHRLAGTYGFDDEGKKELRRNGQIIDGAGRLILREDGTVDCSAGHFFVYTEGKDRDKLPDSEILIPFKAETGSCVGDLRGRDYAMLILNFRLSDGGHRRSAFYVTDRRDAVKLWQFVDPDYYPAPLVKLGSETSIPKLEKVNLTVPSP